MGRGVESGEVADQEPDGPAVDDEVMGDEDEDVFLRAQVGEDGADERRAIERERGSRNLLRQGREACVNVRLVT